MSAKFAQVRSEALELTDDERGRLAHELLASLDGPDGTPEEIEAAWGEEIANRVEQFERGEAKLVDGEESSRRLREKLRARHGR